MDGENFFEARNEGTKQYSQWDVKTADATKQGELFV